MSLFYPDYYPYLTIWVLGWRQSYGTRSFFTDFMVVVFYVMSYELWDEQNFKQGVVSKWGNQIPLCWLCTLLQINDFNQTSTSLL